MQGFRLSLPGFCWIVRN